ncbi:thiamine-phosphate kinase [Candidatus Micrarchaeota archaeon]|nr:thiamine-phosphate kinase [Candidatus Micrarchaeota archaeon]
MATRKDNFISDFDEDAAIFEFGGKKMAITTDMGFFKTHLLVEDAESIGRKIVTSSVTDLLAKGALPKYLLLNIGAPAELEMDILEKMYGAMSNELQKYSAHLIGGDTNKSPEFFYSTAFLGEIEGRPILRNGAQEGDCIVLTGPIGNAAAGYLMLKNKLSGPQKFIEAQQNPQIDFELCKRIWPHANAGIDVSDGLAFELGEIARLSKKRITIEWERIPIDKEFLHFCEANGFDPEELALHYGEDYQIIFTTPQPTEGIVAGRVEEGEGIFLERGNKQRKLAAKGYEHFVSN